MNTNTSKRYLNGKLLDAMAWGLIDEVKTMISNGMSCLANNEMMSGIDPLLYEEDMTLLHFIAALSTLKEGNQFQKKDLLELLEMVLDKGENINALDQYGNTPLHRACLMENVEYADFLRQHGADNTIKNKSKDTPISLAQKIGNEELLKAVTAPVKLRSTSNTIPNTKTNMR